MEMVDSLEEVKSSRSVSGKSALNKISQNSQFKKKVSLEEQEVQKEGRFPRGRHIAFVIYDFFQDSMCVVKECGTLQG